LKKNTFVSLSVFLPLSKNSEIREFQLDDDNFKILWIQFAPIKIQIENWQIFDEFLFPNGKV